MRPPLMSNYKGFPSRTCDNRPWPCSDASRDIFIGKPPADVKRCEKRVRTAELHGHGAKFDAADLMKDARRDSIR